MTNREAIAKNLADWFFALARTEFANENFWNAVDIKSKFGYLIKNGIIGKYENLSFENYKFLFDVVSEGETYRVGVDFGRQAVHITIGPGNVYSLYYRETSNQ